MKCKQSISYRISAVSANKFQKVVQRHVGLGFFSYDYIDFYIQE